MSQIFRPRQRRKGLQLVREIKVNVEEVVIVVVINAPCMAIVSSYHLKDTHTFYCSKLVKCE